MITVVLSTKLTYDEADRLITGIVLITDCGLAVINCEDNRFIGQLTL